MKKYDHKKIESKWQKEWARKKIYKTDSNKKKAKYYVLDMFPYLSGEGLHVGHPKGYIATDIISRKKRMEGLNVLHPMGFDSFGLPAENYAIKTKTHPEISVKKNVARFKKQLEIIGFDYDWSREVMTSDPKFYKWTQWTFLKMLEKGLAYESFEPVNWCPVDKTVLANEDVENGRCERCGAIVEKRPMRQWVLRITKYADRLLKDLAELDWPESIKESQRNWIGRSEGAEIKFQITNSKLQIEVFTTRADTLFGATYLVLAPENKIISDLRPQISNWDEVQKYIDEARGKTEIDRTDAKKEKSGVELKGVKAKNPASGDEIPIWIADYVLPDYGTGAVMGVPAHDERDFQFAKKYILPIKHVIMHYNFDHSFPPREGKKDTVRDVVHVILRNPKNKTVLMQFLKGEEWGKEKPRNFIIGGIEEGESAIDAAMREVKEETGYKNIKFVSDIPLQSSATFFAAHKDVNRTVYVKYFVFDLVNDEKDKITEDEHYTKDSHEIRWVPYDEVEKTLTVIGNKYSWKYFNDGGYAFIDDGVLVNSHEFDRMKSEEAREKITKKFGRKVVKYKLRDWVFSRQRYWGEPIPVLKDAEGKVFPVPEKDLPIKLPKVKSYEPTGTGESPLANIKNWVNVKKNGKVLRRETNTMPQWAGSSWYYLRYMDPRNNKKLVDPKNEKYWNQVDFYVGGAEHATRHLIYARFWHKFLYDIGTVSTKEPFKKLQNVGLIIGPDGKKMSKRFGNVINPDEIVKTWGADTLRLYEMFMGPFTDSIAWNTENMIGVRRFLEKVWRLQSKLTTRDSRPDNLLHKTIKKVTEDIETMSFNTAISSMMILVNELDRAPEVSKGTFDILLKLLAPFAPHITDEIWREMGNNKSIHLEKWPKYNPKKIIEQTVSIAVQINGKVRGVITTEAGRDESEIKDETLAVDGVKKWVEGKEIKKIIYVKDRVINIVLT